MMNNLNDICIYTRSYIGDVAFLPYLYKSIERYCSGFGDVVLVLEEKDVDLVSPYVPSWVRIVSEESFAPGTIQHKYSKLTADLHTDKSFIFHIDSDSVFTCKPEISDLFLNDKPFLEYSSYEHLVLYQNGEQGVEYLKIYCKENVLPVELPIELVKLGVKDTAAWMLAHYQEWLSQSFESWFVEWFEDWKRRFGVDLWKDGTSYALGVAVEHEFSRRPEKLYPRELYSRARGHVEKRFNMDFKSFISSRIGRQTEGVSKESYFSDLNFMGAYLYYYMNSEIEWIDIESKGYEFRKKFVKQYISYDLLRDGKLIDSAKKELDAMFD